MSAGDTEPGYGGLADVRALPELLVEALLLGRLVMTTRALHSAARDYLGHRAVRLEMRRRAEQRARAEADATRLADDDAPVPAPDVA